MHEVQQQEAINQGGLAPAGRQCQYAKSDGARCRDWALRGHDECHRHHRWQRARPERPIDIPLLEDEGSLIYVLSQVAQSLAWGTIPPANGQGILNVCRLVQTTLTTRLETSKLRYKVRRAGIPEHEIFGADAIADASAHPGNPTQQANAVSGHPTQPANISGAANAESGALNPVKTPPSNLRFRDLKKNWDNALQRTENAASEMYSKRSAETPEDFVAARATPFEHLAEEDRQLAKEIEYAQALVQAAQAQAAQAAQAQASAVEAC